MSWHFSQGQEAASWEGSSLDGAPSALLKLIPTHAECYLHGRLTAASNRSPFGMTLRRSTGTSGAESLTWFLADSLVRTYLPSEQDKGLMADEVSCGPRWQGSLARFNPDLRLWKTRQCSLFGGLIEFAETWPRWGMMHDGELFLLPTPALRICENEYGLLPTPSATSFDSTRPNKKGGIKLREALAMLPTPRCSRGFTNPTTGKTRNDCLTTKLLGEPVLGMRPHPRFVEWMMGWPIGWTECTQSETDKFRRWLRSHGASSQPDFRALERVKA